MSRNAKIGRSGGGRSLTLLIAGWLSMLVLWGPFSFSTAAAQEPVQPVRPEIGVYYYPGWHSIATALGATREPWSYLQTFPERMPLRGWYRGADPGLVKEQMAWMYDAGIDYVAFDWYYDYSKIHLAEPLEAYRKLSDEKPKFSVMWANHGQQTSEDDWKKIVAIWIDYFRDKSYYKIDGRDVVFVFSVARFDAAAKAAGSDTATWIQQAQAQVKAAGLPGIYFIGSVNNGDPDVLRTLAPSGFDAVSAYNLNVDHPPTEAGGYRARTDSYQRQWKKFLDLSGGVPLVVPMTSGWDRRPWGGSKDPRDDYAISSDAEFSEHLQAARRFMAERGLRTGVVCCWNEYGEGSFIEPTQSDRFGHLNALKSVFGGR
jgi:hypothetical protein